jgi:hypothetical protein
VFCPELMRMFNAADNGAGGQKLLEAVCTYLDHTPPCGESIPDWAEPLFEAPLKIFRALAGLLSPVPQFYDAKVCDVKYLYPDEGRASTTFVRELGKVARVWVPSLREKQFWVTRREAFMKRAGIEAAEGAPCLEAYNTAKRLSDEKYESTLEERCDFYKQFSKDAADWKRKFRKGATADVQVAIVNLVKEDIKALAAGTPQIPFATLVTEALTQCEAPEVADMKTTVLRHMSLWRESANRNEISSVSMSFLAAQTCGNVLSLATAFEACGAKILPTEVADQLHQAILKSFEFVSTVQVGSWADMLMLWRLARTNIEAFANLGEQMSVPLINTASAFEQTGRIIFDWHMAVTAFSPEEDIYNSFSAARLKYMPVVQNEWKVVVSRLPWTAFPAYPQDMPRHRDNNLGIGFFTSPPKI